MHQFIMRLWTIQGFDIYKQLQKEGIAFCTKPYHCDDDFVYAYNWLALQMRHRIGEPPVCGLEYPLWAWYQYNSTKQKYPPKSPHEMQEGLNVYMEIEIPDNQVLLSDYINWHAVLNQAPLADGKKIEKKTDMLDKVAGRVLRLKDYPLEVQKEIEKSWEAVFDLDRRDKDVGRIHRRNRSIQATFWVLKSENVVSTEIWERRGNLVKRVNM